MEEAMTKSHFCYKCLKIVNPIMKLEIVCPFCQCGFIEELEYTARDYNDNDNSYCNGKLYAICLDARDYNDNDNSYCNGKLYAICLDGQLMIPLYWNRRHSPKEDAFLDLVLPGCRHGHGPDSVCTAEHQESKQAEADSNSFLLAEEMAVPELGSTYQTSPPCSPNFHSSMPTTKASDDKDPDFRLKEGDS